MPRRCANVWQNLCQLHSRTNTYLSHSLQSLSWHSSCTYLAIGVPTRVAQPLHYYCKAYATYICLHVGRYPPIDKILGGRGATTDNFGFHKMWGTPIELWGSPCYNAGMLRHTESGCLEWTGSVDRHGYGRIRRRKGGKTVEVAAHREALFRVKPPPDPSCFALHTCDNKLCCNPEHLYWGDAKQNYTDMVQRDRVWSRSDKALQEVKHRIIHSLRQEGYTERQIMDVVRITAKAMPPKL